jgi:NAD(P)-dependent dehydrogenase (short-subunit alcohol dehydrogenase family)
MELGGKVALVTGAGSGIGRVAALRFAKEGAKVAALSHTESEIRSTVAEIERAGGAGLALTTDIAQAEPMARAVEQVVKEWGRLDIVFANAGINGVWAPLDELQPEEWDRTININLRGAFLTLHYAVPHLKKQGGSVIITSSINGTRVFSNAGTTAYSCTKAAQVALAKMAALELAKHRIRVNVICPGRIATEISDNTSPRHLDTAKEPVEYPEGKIPLTDDAPGSADEVAELVLFLASDRSRHITGTPVWIDGAQSLLIG